MKTGDEELRGARFRTVVWLINKLERERIEMKSNGALLKHYLSGYFITKTKGELNWCNLKAGTWVRPGAD